MTSREEVLRLLQSMPEEKQKQLVAEMGRLFEQMKADWEADPKNAGETISYSELWRRNGPKPNRSEDHDG
jgi:hypothetical protein